MTNLTQMEVNSIREIVSGHQMMANKLKCYANDCQDAQIKQLFSQASQDAQKSAQTLIGML